MIQGKEILYIFAPVQRSWEAHDDKWQRRLRSESGLRARE